MTSRPDFLSLIKLAALNYMVFGYIRVWVWILCFFTLDIG